MRTARRATAALTLVLVGTAVGYRERVRDQRSDQTSTGNPERAVPVRRPRA